MAEVVSLEEILWRSVTSSAEIGTCCRVAKPATDSESIKARFFMHS